MQCLARSHTFKLIARGPVSATPHLRFSRKSFATMASVRDLNNTAEAAQLVTKEGGYTYLDVRSPQEFQSGHAPGAVNVPWAMQGPAGMVPNAAFLSTVKEQFPNAAQPLMVACLKGGRSTAACAVLKETYTDLVNFKPSWEGWTAAQLPVEKN